MSKHLSPSTRLFLLHDKLDDLMEVLVAAERTDAEEVRMRNVERRYWPVKRELMRRLKERDALIAEVAALKSAANVQQTIAGPEIVTNDPPDLFPRPWALEP